MTSLPIIYVHHIASRKNTENESACAFFHCQLDNDKVEGTELFLCTQFGHQLSARCRKQGLEEKCTHCRPRNLALAWISACKKEVYLES